MGGIWRALRLLLPIALALLVITCSSEGASPEGSGPGAPPTREEVVAILTRHRDEVASAIAPDVRAAIEAEAAKYPLTSGGAAPIQQLETQAVRPRTIGPPPAPADRERVLRAAIGQRDWAYATLGIVYSLRGGLEEASPHLLDAAFLCFLEAAILVPDEPEHLANVAFHMNDRSLFADARAVLLFARGLSPKNVAVRNNLAFTMARLGDPKSAISEQLAATSLAPGASLFWRRLARYYAQANLPEQAAMAEAAASQAAPPPTTAVIPPSSSTAAEALVEVLVPLDEKLAEAFGAIGNAPGVPATLEDDWDAIPKIAEIRARREACRDRVAEQTAGLADAVRDVLICEQCDRIAAAEERQLSHTEASHIIARTRTWASLWLIAVSEQLAEGLGGIATRPGLSDEDRAGLEAYWQAHMASWVEVVTSSVEANVDGVLILTSHYDAELANLSCGRGNIPPWLWSPDEILPFGGKIVVWFGVGQLTIDIKAGQVELQGGQLIQGKIGWNFKTNDPIVGVGVGVNLDGVIETGAFVTLDGRSGLKGSIEFSPAGWPMVLGGVDPPQIEAKQVIPDYATMLN